MKPIARLGYLAVACALLVTTFAIIGPRAVRAVVATLIRDQDNAGRHAWAGSCTTDLSVVDYCAIIMPANEEVVIQTVTNETGAPPAQHTTLFKVVTLIGGAPTVLIDALQTDDGFLQPGSAYFNGTYAVTGYQDPSPNQALCEWPQLSATISTTAFCYLTGYRVAVP